MKLASMVFVAFWLACAVGWGLNIYKLMGALSAAATFAAVTPFDLVRLVGVFVVPLGTLLGFI